MCTPKSARSGPLLWALLLLGSSALALPSFAAALPLPEDYNQWKKALHTNEATAADQITAPRGFRVELLRSAGRDEGSWVALAFDPTGRLVVAREDRGLLRLTLRNNPSEPVRVETINTNLLECRGLLSAHQALYANANNAKALYRLRDTDGDDQFDEVKLLRATPGGVGHGRNQLALGPDGMIYSIHGDDVRLPVDGVATNSAFRNYGEDRLLPCLWDKHLFNADAQMPFGHLIRTDASGQTWELIAGGMRNPYGIDFNQAGDLFTFDADMEWDVGLPWYHPTRVLHLTPGGDYGWRRGTGVLPVWSPDTLPSAVEIGLGSPTAVKFGTRSNFPEHWREALFILDWAYGKVHAVHLRRAGASYTGQAEVFLSGRPLNVTGLDFGPDGAMYVITGGRRTQSGLYRVTWEAHKRSNASKQRASQPAETSRAIPWGAISISDIWAALDDSDLWVRHRARVALEASPVDGWRERALNEKRPTAAGTALLALVRVGDKGLQAPILRRLHELVTDSLSPEQQLIALRALAVCFIRMGPPGRVIAERFNELWEGRYPSADPRVNQALCELLVYLESTSVVRKTIPLLASAGTQEEKLLYLFNLRLVKTGWTIEERRKYFEWLDRARREFQGANLLPTALNYIRADAEGTLTSTERSGLEEILTALDKPVTLTPPPVIQRPFVKDWRMPDFGGSLAKGGNRDRGKELFTAAACAQCHRLGSEGSPIGPDLTGVGGRLDRRALLESILEPSKVVADIYRNVTITTKAGVIVDGRIMSEDPKNIMIATNPIDLDNRRSVAKSDIVSRRASDLSPMPEGLLNTLTREEILDLLAWIESGGESRDAK